MSRRDLLAYSAALLGAAGRLGAKGHVAKARVSAITDEIAPNESDAITFAKQYGLQLVELRHVPNSKDLYASLPAPEVKQYAADLAANKLKVSMLRTDILKNSPGSAKDDLVRAIAAAQILGTGRIGIFTGMRGVAVEKGGSPPPDYARLAQTLANLIAVAEKEKMRLLIEPGASQNIATAADLKAILDLVPSKALGFNWIPRSFPKDYELLPKSRMLNVQISSALLGGGPQQIDWRRVFEALQKDGFQGGISVETGPFADTFEKPGDAVREVMHIVGEVE